MTPRWPSKDGFPTVILIDGTYYLIDAREVTIDRDLRQYADSRTGIAKYVDQGPPWCTVRGRLLEVRQATPGEEAASRQRHLAGTGYLP